MSNFFISQESVNEMINDLQDEIFSSNINIAEEKYNAIHESLVEKVKLGKFNVYSIRIDRDANCFVTFKSNVDSSYVENFSQLMVDEAVITFKAKIIAEE